MTFTPTIRMRPFNAVKPRATVIGYLEVSEPKEIAEDQEHAAWYRYVMIRPGSYPLFFSSNRADNFIAVRLPGEITRSYFGPRTPDETGKEYQISLQFNDYVIAQEQSTLGTVRLLPEYAGAEKRIWNWRETADQSLD